MSASVDIRLPALRAPRGVLDDPRFAETRIVFDTRPIPFCRVLGGEWIVPDWLITEFLEGIRPTPEQLAERRARQAEHDRRRAEWWAGLPRHQRFQITNRRRRSRIQQKISDARGGIACKIAPWLAERDDW